MTKEEIFESITGQTKKMLPILKDHVFQKSDCLKELGANSLDRAEIVENTMELLSLNIARVEIFGAKTIGELSDLLYEKQKKR